jgi:hypothetical protein
MLLNLMTAFTLVAIERLNVFTAITFYRRQDLIIGSFALRVLAHVQGLRSWLIDAPTFEVQRVGISEKNVRRFSKFLSKQSRVSAVSKVFTILMVNHGMIKLADALDDASSNGAPNYRSRDVSKASLDHAGSQT